MSDSNESEPEALFNKMLFGAVADEDWINYKDETKHSGLILESSDSEDDSYFADSRSVSPLPVQEIYTTTVELVRQTSENASEASDDDDTPKCDTEKPSLSWNSESAFKFINGEINILDLENMMEDHEDESSSEIKNPVPSRSAGRNLENMTEKRTKECSSEAKNGGSSKNTSNRGKNISDFENQANGCSSGSKSASSSKIASYMEASELEKSAQEYDEEKKLARKKGRRKKSDVPKELEGVMGAAHINYVDRKYDDAIKMCMEIIRQAPNAYEPFHTLGIIYEEKKDMEKALQYYLLAAYLHPSYSADDWSQLAEMSLELGHVEQAISCYSKAIKIKPTDTKLLFERCDLYMQQGDKKRALIGYEQVIKQLNQPEASKTCVDLSRVIAKIYHENQEFESAVRILDAVFTKYPQLITSEDVNFLLELQINQQLYACALKNLVQHCGVGLLLNGSQTLQFEEVEKLTVDQFPQINACSVPVVLPIDLHAKLTVCVIHLKSLNIVEDLLQRLREESPEEIGDLYLDVAEAFIHIEEYNQALPLLSALLASENYNLAGTWLLYAECLNALDRTEEAIEAYKKVIEMAPGHQKARLSLSDIYLNTGCKDQAINCLKQDYEEGIEDTIIDLQVLHKRIKLLHDDENWDEFLEAATLAQYSHCYCAKTPEEFNVILNNLSAKSRNEALRELPPSVITTVPVFINKNISTEEMWELFKKVCGKLYCFKRLEELQDLCVVALTSAMFSKNVTMKKDTEFLALLSSYYNRNEKYSYQLVKDLVTKNINSSQAWNLFCLVITNSQDIRHNKFCLRLTMKNQDHLALGLLNGHNALVSGSYKHALAEYLSIMEDQPQDWLVTFCVGITYFHMASQKFSSKRYYLAIQGMRHLKQYMKLRGVCQETLYNIGRALHQLGMNSEALHYYKRALDISPVITPEKDEGVFDFTKEIAYNVSQIYESSGAHQLAYMYIRTYIIV